MVKCKRNVILIFGYLLTVLILFVPYKLTKFVWDGEKESYAYWNYEENLTEVQREQLEKYNNAWDNYTFWKYEEKSGEEASKFTELIRSSHIPRPPYPQEKVVRKKGFVFLPWFIRGKINQTKESKKFKEAGYLFRVNWLNTYQEKFYTFKEISKVNRYSINTDLIVIELVIFFLVAGFAYIIFCLVLRKDKKKEER